MSANTPQRTNITKIPKTEEQTQLKIPTTIHEAWLALNKYLETERHHPTGLTVKKIAARGNLQESESTPERIVFEVERHNAIGGAQYRRGLPMSNFETWIKKYSYEPLTNSLSEIDGRLTDRKFDPLSEVWEWEMDFYVMVTGNATAGNYRVEDSNNSLSFTSPSLEEAETVMADKVANWEWGSSLIGVVDEGPELDTIIDTMKTRASEIAVDKLRRAWPNLQESQD